MYEPYIEVCRRLAELSPCRGGEQKSLLVNSGAEAVENAVKIARAATGPAGGGRLRQRLPRPHAADDDDDGEGRPVQARLRPVRARGLPHAGAVPVPRASPGRRDRRARAAVQGATSTRSRSPASCSSRCRARAASSRCRPTSRARLEELSTRTGSSTSTTRCSRGVGRTGPVWAIEHYGVEPDLLVAGKSLGGGLPLASVTGRAEVDGRGRARRARRHVRRQPGRVRRRDRRARRGAAPAFRPRAEEIGRTAARARLEAIAARAPASARCAGSGRCSRSSSPSRAPSSRRGRQRRGARARADAALVRAVRQRDPDPRPVRDHRRAARARPRHPGGGAWHARCRALDAARRRRTAPDIHFVGVRKTTATSSRSTTSTSTIARGEFFTLLGPSGSGKTTTLRLIAGFERPDAGPIRLARRGRDAQAAVRRATSTPSSRTTRSSRT